MNNKYIINSQELYLILNEGNTIFDDVLASVLDKEGTIFGNVSQSIAKNKYDNNIKAKEYAKFITGEIENFIEIAEEKMGIKLHKNGQLSIEDFKFLRIDITTNTSENKDYIKYLVFKKENLKTLYLGIFHYLHNTVKAYNPEEETAIDDYIKNFEKVFKLLNKIRLHMLLMKSRGLSINDFIATILRDMNNKYNFDNVESYSFLKTFKINKIVKDKKTGSKGSIKVTPYNYIVDKRTLMSLDFEEFLNSLDEHFNRMATIRQSLVKNLKYVFSKYLENDKKNLDFLRTTQISMTSSGDDTLYIDITKKYLYVKESTIVTRLSNVVSLLFGRAKQTSANLKFDDDVFKTMDLNKMRSINFIKTFSAMFDAYKKNINPNFSYTTKDEMIWHNDPSNPAVSRFKILALNLLIMYMQTFVTDESLMPKNRFFFVRNFDELTKFIKMIFTNYPNAFRNSIFKDSTISSLDDDNNYTYHECVKNLETSTVYYQTFLTQSTGGYGHRNLIMARVFETIVPEIEQLITAGKGTINFAEGISDIDSMLFRLTGNQIKKLIDEDIKSKDLQRLIKSDTTTYLTIEDVYSNDVIFDKLKKTQQYYYFITSNNRETYIASKINLNDRFRVLQLIFGLSNDSFDNFSKELEFVYLALRKLTSVNMEIAVDEDQVKAFNQKETDESIVKFMFEYFITDEFINLYQSKSNFNMKFNTIQYRTFSFNIFRILYRILNTNLTKIIFNEYIKQYTGKGNKIYNALIETMKLIKSTEIKAFSDIISNEFKYGSTYNKLINSVSRSIDLLINTEAPKDINFTNIKSFVENYSLPKAERTFLDKMLNSIYTTFKNKFTEVEKEKDFLKYMYINIGESIHIDFKNGINGVNKIEFLNKDFKEFTHGNLSEIKKEQLKRKFIFNLIYFTYFIKDEIKTLYGDEFTGKLPAKRDLKNTIKYTLNKNAIESSYIRDEFSESFPGETDSIPMAIEMLLKHFEKNKK